MSDDVARKAAEALDHAAHAGSEAADQAREAITGVAEAGSDAVARARKILQDGLEALQSKAPEYKEKVAQSADEAQRYVVERVKERPLTAAVAGLGIGLILGLMLSGSGGRK